MLTKDLGQDNRMYGIYLARAEAYILFIL